MNKVLILATITRGIELKYSQSGTAIGSFGIAYNDNWKDQQGNKQEKVHFFDVTAFGKQAEIINSFFQKGSRILIEGSLDFQSWEDQSGGKRSKVGIKLSGFSFVDRKSDATVGKPQQEYQQPQRAAPTVQVMPTIEDDMDNPIPF